MYNRREVTSGSQPRRVLVIDDDPISLAIAAVLLEAEGCIVLQACSGEEALSVLATEAEPPDCVLADLRMPSLSGPELAHVLRQGAPRALLLAMSATPPAQVEGYQAVLRKPLTPEDLQAVFAEQPVHSAGAAMGADGDSDLDEAVFERLQRAMPPNALEEVVSAFVTDTGTRIQAMRAADPEAVRRQAHTVRGGAAMVGAIRVSVTAAIIESGIDQADDRLRKVDELELHLRRAENILKQRLQA